MCSIVSENSFYAFTRGVRHGVEEHDNKATTQELGIYASAAFRLSSEPAPYPVSYGAPSAHATNADPSIKACVRDQLRRAIKKNFEGREYITRPTLLQVMAEDIVRCLIQQHMSEWTQSGLAKTLLRGSSEDIVGYVEKEARVLLALCIFVDVPMRSFLRLLEAGINDSSLPLPRECPICVENDNFARIFDTQWIFLPFDLFARPGQLAVPEEYVIPLAFDRNKDFIGCGAYSDVFRVTMDDGPCSSSMVICLHLG
jgi:hypothetical protein